ncbi:hypothetical protein PCE1_000390 [Barthelona sp. PCE]
MSESTPFDEGGYISEEVEVQFMDQSFRVASTQSYEEFTTNNVEEGRSMTPQMLRQLELNRTSIEIDAIRTIHPNQNFANPFLELREGEYDVEDTGSVFKRTDASSMRERLYEWYRVRTNFKLDLVLISINLFGIVYYICSTFYIDLPRWVLALELAFAIFFCLELVFEMIIANGFIDFFTNPSNLIDIASIVPTFFRFFGSPENITCFFFFRIGRILRLTGHYRLHLMRVGVYTPLILPLLMVVTFAILSVGLYLIFEIKTIDTVMNDHLNFFSGLYFLSVMVSTVGFGDISPETSGGRAVVIFTIISGVSLIPIVIRRFGKIAQQRREFLGEAKLAHSEELVLLTGAVTSYSVMEFVSQFYAQKKQLHDFSRPKIIVLSTYKPDTQLTDFLTSRMYREKVEILRGSAVSPNDLRRARIKEVKAVFVLAEKQPISAIDEDARVVLRALAIRRLNKDVPVIAECHLQRTVHILRFAGVSEVLPLQPLSLNLMAMCSRMIGLPAFITNLFRAYVMPPALKNVDSDRAQVPRLDIDVLAVGAGVSEPPLKRDIEYTYGLNCNVISVPIPPSFIGHAFATLTANIRRKLNIIVFGVQVVSTEKVLINPLLYRMRPKDALIVVAHQSVNVFNLFLNLDIENCELAFEPTYESIANIQSPSSVNGEVFERIITKPIVDSIASTEEIRSIGITSTAENVFDLFKSPTSPEPERRRTTFHNHIIIVGDSLDEVVLLIKRIRSVYKRLSIVVLTTDIDPEHFHESVLMEEIGKVHFRHCTFIGQHTYKSIDIDTARRVLILSDKSAQKRVANMRRSALVSDTQIGFSTQVEEYLLQDSRAISRFLSATQACNGNITDRIVMQVVVASNCNIIPPCHEGDFFLSEVFSAGSISAFTSADIMLASRYFVSPIIAVFETLLGFYGDEIPRQLTQFKTPKNFHDKTFKEMFEWMILNRGIICMGLFRQRKSSGLMGYVYTNPTDNCVLCADDLVYAIRPFCVRNYLVENLPNFNRNAVQSARDLAKLLRVSHANIGV